MLPVILAWLVAAACIAASARWLVRMLELARSAEALLAALRAIGAGAARGRDESMVQDQLGDAIGAPSDAHRIAALNDRLADVSRELQVGSDIPRAATRIALFSGTALAVIELSRSLPQPSVASVALSFLAGVTGSLVSAQLGRLGGAAAARTRAAWNEVIRRVEKAARTAAGPASSTGGSGGAAPVTESRKP
jgi:hypothetical protein